MSLHEVIYLKLLLTTLPPALPIGSENDYPFKNFVPDLDRLEEGLPAAVSAVFKRVFGWNSANEVAANGQPYLKHRGPNVIAAADVLQQSWTHFGLGRKTRQDFSRDIQDLPSRCRCNP